MQTPCKDCKDRHPGCHGMCPRYAEFRVALDAIRERRREAQKSPISDDAIKMFHKQMRKRR
jgi:hypothetical protein